MLNKIFKSYIYPISTLAGSIIGVGFLSLPYITLKSGFFLMAIYFIVLTSLMVFINLTMGEISLKTPDSKRLPGFVGFYLGKRMQNITHFLNILSSIGVLLIYLIVGGQFLKDIFSPIFGGGNLYYTTIYWIIGSLIIYFGIKIVSKIELLSLIFLFSILIFIFIKGFPYMDIQNIFSNNLIINDWRIWFLPYGPIIFSLSTGYIPETEEMINDNKKNLKKIIIISTLIPAFFYTFFIFLILSLSGQNTTEVALTGLSNFFSPGVFSSILFIGVVTTFVAFVTNSLLLKETLMYDLGLKNNTLAWLLTTIPPFALLLVGFNFFIPLISFIGGVFSAIGIILVLMMRHKIGKAPKIIYPLMFLFSIGIIYEIVSFLNF